MIEERIAREGDLVLPPGVFAFILDETKGQVTIYSGPHKASLSQTDSPVVFNNDTGRFEKCDINKAIQSNIVAETGEYVVLTNPGNINQVHPGIGKAETGSAALQIGSKENIEGPVTFPLWPGQIAEVVPGHLLRSNQYLLVRVYNETDAKANWGSAVVKQVQKEDDTPETETSNPLGISADDLSIGKLFTVKGTDVSFFIPPTGIEVLAEGGNYIREAITLERLDYCILLAENGNKRYVKGPEVVFPEPTEKFVTNSSNSNKQRAFELNIASGVYIKVIADYEEHGQNFTAGQELFITGKEQAIYYPRQEHALIKYGGQEIHYAIAIPKGEARYRLSRLTGEIDLVKGPAMLLPDPRTHVIVRRVLDESLCNLYYPGNVEALNYNKGLTDTQEETGYVEDSAYRSTRGDTMLLSASGAGPSSRTKKRSFTDEMHRSTSYTPPRTVTLDTKYDGAITINVYTGYAVQVVNKVGERRVVQGPQTVLLEYDEGLEKTSLSTGKPKQRSHTFDTVYLRVMSNPISDLLGLKTKDLVDVTLELKYLVRFAGDSDKWFNVDNYVHYMCDHMRSLIGNHVRQINVQDFYTGATEFLRDLVLGVKVEGEDRPCHVFNENDMEIYDLEVISVTIKDHEIADLLETSRQEELVNTIKLEREERKLLLIIGQEEAKRQIDGELAITATGKGRFALLEITRKAEAQKAEDVIELDIHARRAIVRDVDRAADILDKELQSKIADENLIRQIDQLVAEAQADVSRAESIAPQLIAALTTLSHTTTMEQMAKYLAPLAIVRDKSLTGTMRQLVKGTPLEGLLDNIEAAGSLPYAAVKPEATSELTA